MSHFFLSKDNFLNKDIFLAGKKSHFNQFVYSGFRTKWCGFWVPPYKYLDFYVYKLNNNWLDYNTQIAFEYYPGYAIRHYKINNIDITETQFCPDSKKSFVSILELTNKTKTNQQINLCLITGINIRKKEENWHIRDYDISYDNLRNSILIQNKETNTHLKVGMGSIEKNIRDNLEISFKNNNTYNDHYPSNEKQRKLDLGPYCITATLNPHQTIKIPFIFTGSHISLKDLKLDHDEVASKWNTLLTEKKKCYKEYRENIIECPNQDINISKAFECASVNMRDLTHESDNGPGIYAGFPWFLDFWGRDTFWSLLSLIDLGDFKTTKSILINYVKNYDSIKGLPTLISMTNDRKYYSDDIDPLFLYVSHYYINCSGDLNFSNKIKPIAKRMIKRLKYEHKIITTDPDGTWMDTYKRIGNSIDIQSIWAEVFSIYNKSKSKELKSVIEILFWNKNKQFLYDTYGLCKDDSKTINSTIPLMFNQLTSEKTKQCLNLIKEEFMTPYGARTRSIYEKEYAPDSYHKGSSWGLTTGWCACAMFRHYYVEEGLALLKSMAEYIHKDTLGAFPETLNSYNGDNLGATMQAWSSSLYIHTIDNYMFGFQSEPLKNTISISPRLPNNWDFASRNNKKLLNHNFNIKFEHNTKQYKIHIVFKKNPSCKLIFNLPFNLKQINSIMYDSKTLKSKTKLELNSKKEMLIIVKLNTD
jgi:hypothetical protein